MKEQISIAGIEAIVLKDNVLKGEAGKASFPSLSISDPKYSPASDNELSEYARAILERNSNFLNSEYSGMYAWIIPAAQIDEEYNKIFVTRPLSADDGWRFVCGLRDMYSGNNVVPYQVFIGKPSADPFRFRC